MSMTSVMQQVLVLVRGAQSNVHDKSSISMEIDVVLRNHYSKALQQRFKVHAILPLTANEYKFVLNECILCIV